MLLLVEHDHVMRTLRSRRCLAQFLSTPKRCDLRVVVFRSARNPDVDQTLRAYPTTLRQRIAITPATPRNADLAFWLHYEVCCATAALRHVGALMPRELWLAVVPPAWADALASHFHLHRLVPTVGEFDERLAHRLHKRLGRGGRLTNRPVLVRKRPGNRPAVAMAMHSYSMHRSTAAGNSHSRAPPRANPEALNTPVRMRPNAAAAIQS